jgi:hypothetical protein
MAVTLSGIRKRRILSVSDDFADTKVNILTGLFGNHNRNGAPYRGGRGPQKSSFDIQNGKIVIFINETVKNKSGENTCSGPWLNLPQGPAADTWRSFEQRLEQQTAIANICGDAGCAVFTRPPNERNFRFKGIYQRKRKTPQSSWIYTRTADVLNLDDWQQA